MKPFELTTWRLEFLELFEVTGDTFASLVAITLTDSELDVEFDSGFGGSKGKPFTAWSEKYVYFPAVYDGSEWIACVSRNPDGQPTSHIGGE